MHKLTCPYLSAVLIGSAAFGVVDARSAEVEGALQYPPPSLGEDAQPPPPARMLPQPVSPRRIQLGTSGSSVPLSRQQLSLLGQLRGCAQWPNRRIRLLWEQI